MRFDLIPHPDAASAAIRAVSADVEWLGGALWLRYRVEGDVAALRVPARASPKRADGLWEHTCFEAFVKAPNQAAYREFNFSPSAEWAAYLFDAYRDGMRPALDQLPPAIAVEPQEDCFEIEIVVPWSWRAPVSGWRLGLSAILEEESGAKSYWAIAHPPGKPDFHHADCFAGELPAPGRS